RFLAEMRSRRDGWPIATATAAPQQATAPAQATQPIQQISSMNPAVSSPGVSETAQLPSPAAEPASTVELAPKSPAVIQQPAPPPSPQPVNVAEARQKPGSGPQRFGNGQYSRRQSVVSTKPSEISLLPSPSTPATSE